MARLSTPEHAMPNAASPPRVYAQGHTASRPSTRRSGIPVMLFPRPLALPLPLPLASHARRPSPTTAGRVASGTLAARAALAASLRAHRDTRVSHAQPPRFAPNRVCETRYLGPSRRLAPKYRCYSSHD